MAKNLSSIRTNVRDHIDEPSQNYWQDTELNRYIATAYLDLWARILQIRKDYFLASGGFQLSTVVGQYRYTTADGVPSGLWHVTAMQMLTSGQQNTIFDPSDPNSPEFIRGLRTDSPVSSPAVINYGVRNLGEIWLSPTPQQVYSVQVDYIQQPTAPAADTDTFALPDAFLDFVEYAATHKALLKGPVGDPQSWATEAENAWTRRILPALDTPRQDQGPDLVIGMFDR